MKDMFESTRREIKCRYSDNNWILSPINDGQAASSVVQRKTVLHLLPDSLLLERGKTDIFLVNLNEDNTPVQQIYFCTVSAEERKKTIPGFSYKTESGNHYAFLLKGYEGTELTITENAATDILRKNFLRKELHQEIPAEQTYASFIAGFFKQEEPSPADTPVKVPAKTDVKAAASDAPKEERTAVQHHAKSAESVTAKTHSNLIQLDGSSRYLTDDATALYMVKKGSVYVSIAPLGKGNLPNRARPYALVTQGHEIPAFCYTSPGDYTRWRFVLIGRGNAEIEIAHGTLTEENKRAFVFGNESASNKKAQLDYPHTGFEGALENLYLKAQLEEQFDIRSADKQELQAAFEGMKLVTEVSSKAAINGKNPVYLSFSYACRALSMSPISEKQLPTVCQTITVESIAEASRVAYRSVKLDEDWFKNDCGVFLSTIDNEPVAVVPSGWNGYTIFFGSNRREEKLSASLAKKIDRNAIVLYRTLSPEKITKKKLFSFALESLRKSDFAAVIILGLIGALIGILIPTLNQKIYDDYIPLGSVSQLVQICVLIASFMVSNLFFEIVKSLSEYRIGSRIGYTLENAVYYRIFHLPESFFRTTESADLAQRISGISEFSNKYIETILVSGLGTVFSLLYLWRMFKYAKKLVGWAIVMILVYSLIIFLISKSTLRLQSKIQEIRGSLSSKLFQFLCGIEKIRMSGSEERTANEYLLSFSEQERLKTKLNSISSVSSTLSGSVTTIFSMVFYFIIVKKILKDTNSGLTTGNFMAFNSAFGSFSSAVLQLMGSLIGIYELKPQFERVRPVLEEAQEDTGKGDIIRSLKGEITLNDIRFSYDKSSANVLDGISLKINPGDYIGIVGRSGCGKSTLLKLLLGFEQPDSGNILYDGKDLKSIDKRSFRKNLGVVLQNGKLISGSIFENITITSPGATTKDVEAVIEKVGLKEDIEKMPMRLQTVLSEDSGTISGGQQQRILIARAIINNPAVLIFDEATSALDNITQAAVCENLDKMNTTRIVVAHRLSTIKNCDRIYVLDKGKIAEQGNYAELMKQKGMFYQLAVRQLVEGENDYED